MELPEVELVAMDAAIELSPQPDATANLVAIDDAVELKKS